MNTSYSEVVSACQALARTFGSDYAVNYLRMNYGGAVGLTARQDLWGHFVNNASALVAMAAPAPSMTPTLDKPAVVQSVTIYASNWGAHRADPSIKPNDFRGMTPREAAWKTRQTPRAGCRHQHRQARHCRPVLRCSQLPSARSGCASRSSSSCRYGRSRPGIRKGSLREIGTDP